MSKIGDVLDKLFVPQSEADAPALHASVDRLCAEAGIKKPKICFVDAEAQSLTPLKKFIYEHMCGAMHIGEPRIVLGEKFRAIMGHHSADAAVSEELESILAHEIAHIKKGDVLLHKVIPLRMSPFIGMLAGIAGVWYYEHLQAKHKSRALNKSEAQIQHDIHTEWKESDKPTEVIVPQVDTATTIAKHIAGGLLGFGVGTAVYAIGHRHIELRADRISAELMGSGKPLANALQTLRSGVQNNISPEIREAYKKENSPLTRWLEGLTHPSDAERIERLNNWSR